VITRLLTVLSERRARHFTTF